MIPESTLIASIVFVAQLSGLHPELGPNPDVSETTQLYDNKWVHVAIFQFASRGKGAEG
jgi:hypothetical protein